MTSDVILCTYGSNCLWHSLNFSWIYLLKLVVDKFYTILKNTVRPEKNVHYMLIKLWNYHAEFLRGSYFNYHYYKNLPCYFFTVLIFLVARVIQIRSMQIRVNEAVINNTIYSCITNSIFRNESAKISDQCFSVLYSIVITTLFSLCVLITVIFKTQSYREP